MSTRIESDSLGTVEVPTSARYGAQTQRAINNFSISGCPMPADFIRALATIKLTAAQVNKDLGLLAPNLADAISVAASAIANGEYADQFPVDVFQTGSGTSTNMNMNEVIAHLASEQSGLSIDPNDHVNMSQSSNDAIPTAIHVSAAIALDSKLMPALEHLHTTLLGKAEQVTGVIKTGRTHLMDAMPIRLEQELHAWASQLEGNYQRLQLSLPYLLTIAQGGTAVGTGINAHPEFAERFAAQLHVNTDLPFTRGDNLFALIASQDIAVAVSGNLKTLAVSLMKIANDLRWMNSGPLAGLGEITLAVLQPGSSIMPGKVNPVIPEAVAMVAADVIGKDVTITLAGQSGNFQLNVMLPIVAKNLLESIHLLANASVALADNAIATFTVNHQAINKALARNPILVTALNPIIGYQKAAQIAKRAYQEDRDIVDVAAEETELSKEQLTELLNPEKLTHGGIN